MILIDDYEKSTGNWTDTIDECLLNRDGRRLCILLRDDTDGFVDRPRHRPGLVGWITSRTGERLYYPSGGDAVGEAVPVSLESLKEIVRIMEMPIMDLKEKALHDAKFF